jgi:sugar lactone lactonase YvrE
MNDRYRFSVRLVLILAGVLALVANGLTVTATESHEARVIEVAPTGQGRAHSVAVSPDGQLLAAGTSLGIYLYDARTLAERFFIPSETWVRSISFSPDGQMLASGSYDPTVRLWRVADGALMRTLEGHTGWVRNVAFSPDGETLASASDDNTVRLWQVSDGTTLRIFDETGARAVAFSPDGALLATGGYDRMIRLWRVSDGSLIREMAGHGDWVRALAFSPDGERLASGAFDATVRLWRVADGELLVTREEHSSSVLGVAFSPDGKLLASASVDETVRLWKMPEAEPYDLLKGHSDFVFSVAFSPDGKTLASASVDNSVRIWHVPQQTSPLAQEIVTVPSDCRACHHPRGMEGPARVIETGCAVCHGQGALALNWCPFLPRPTGPVPLSFSSPGPQNTLGVPIGDKNIEILIFQPGNGEHFYTQGKTLNTAVVVGKVYSPETAFNDIIVELSIWADSNQITTVTTKPEPSGHFSFSFNLAGLGNLPNTDAPQEYKCLECHYEAPHGLLPASEIRLVVIATTSESPQARDERLIVISRSGTVTIPIEVLSENGQPVQGATIQAETRLYEWRERIFQISSDAQGNAILQVEALSQVPTTYQISVPPVVVNGIRYESVEPVEVTLPPGASSASPVTLRVRATQGQLSGQLTPPLARPVSVSAIHLPDGASQWTQSAAQGDFIFPDLPIGRYLITSDPAALAALGLSLPPQEVDLSQKPHASVDLPLVPLPGASLSGSIRQPDGRPLPFAYVSLEGLTASRPVLPASGRFSLAGLSSGVHTLLVSAPGFYSQAQVVDTANPQPLDLTLVMRPETRLLAWGAGQVVAPPETRLVEDGLQLALERGWLWGEGGESRPLTIRLGQTEIMLAEGKFAVENLPGQAAWFYLFAGQATIRWGEAGEPIPVEKGQMVALADGFRPVPVPYDPVVVAALHPEGELPIVQTWQPSLQALVRDRLALAGITAAQVVTFITYLMVFIAIVAAPFAGIYWWRRSRLKLSKSESRSDDDTSD